jgi:diphthamide synthase (EF-2-diphthine--ammonia ligase)
VEITGEPSYKDSYVAGMRALTASHGVQVIATGDMDLVGTMKRNWIEECGEAAGVDAFLPLWRTDREANVHALLREGFRVAGPHISGYLLVISLTCSLTEHILVMKCVNLSGSWDKRLKVELKKEIV